MINPLTHSENQDVLLLLEGADGLVGNLHADKQPLILGSHHRASGRQRGLMVNELYLLHCREKGGVVDGILEVEVRDVVEYGKRTHQNAPQT